MIKINNLTVEITPDSDSYLGILKRKISKLLKCKESEIHNLEIIKKSIDARKKDDIKFVFSVACKIDNEKVILKKYAHNRNISEYKKYIYEVPRKTKPIDRPVVIGFGPAGIFCSYILALCGTNPIVIERGSDVDTRQSDILNFWENGNLNTESNIQFGEGGAGTFSDGKLNTGINDKRIRFVLETFVKFGADKKILYEAKPHIGTDVLRKVIKNIRQEIIRLGGTVLFNSYFCDFTSKNGLLSAIKYINNGIENVIETSNCVLAVGHSSRDTIRMLNNKKIIMSQKPFSVGVRIEHLQKDINKSLLGEYSEEKQLIPASYKQAIHLSSGRGVYTFCMCPGGVVVAAASEKGRLVTNGMSYSKRDGVNANSALLVGINSKDLKSSDVLAGVKFQQEIEEKAFIAAGRNYHAPVIKVGDFLEYKNSNSFGKVFPTYPLKTEFCELESYLPSDITESLRAGIVEIGKKFKGFDDDEAVLTGVESRSTSPVRIERNEKGESVSVSGIYPCGEGAGYAGGIMSAAVDGIKCAEKIIKPEDI